MNIKNMSLLGKIDWLIKQINGLSNQVFPPAYYPTASFAGTVSTVGGTKNVVGVGTAFSPAHVDTRVMIEGELHRIKTVTDATNLATYDNIVGTYSGVPMLKNAPPLVVYEGRVGIANPTPGASLVLDVVGNSQFSGNTSFNGGVAFFLSTGASFLNGAYTTLIRVDGTNERVGILSPSPQTSLDVGFGNIRMASPDVPATATSTGVVGEMAWDANYIYQCVATDSWKRSAIAVW
jgi:hypothetical protein